MTGRRRRGLLLAAVIGVGSTLMVPTGALSGAAFAVASGPGRTLTITGDAWGYSHAGTPFVLDASSSAFFAQMTGGALDVQIFPPGDPFGWGLLVRPMHGDDLVPGQYVTTGDSASNAGILLSVHSTRGGCSGGGSLTLRALDRFPDGTVAFADLSFDQSCDIQPHVIGQLLVDNRADAAHGLSADRRAESFDGAPWPAGSAPRTVTVRNPGTSPVVVGQASATRPEFAIDGDACSGRTLPGGGSCGITLTFRDAYVRVRSGALLVPNDGEAGTLTVGLAGTMDFGDAAVPRNAITIDSDPSDAIAHGVPVDLARSPGVAVDETSTHDGVTVTALTTTGTSWTVFLEAPTGEDLMPGIYEDATAWSSAGTGPRFGVWGSSSFPCHLVTGRFVVLALERNPDDTLRHFHARFEAHCRQNPAGASGDVEYDERSVADVTGGVESAPASVELLATPWPAGSAPHPVVLTNHESTAVHVGTLSTSDDEFSTVDDGCSGATLPAGGTCSFVATYLSAVPGLRHSLVIVPTDAVTGWTAVPLDGSMDFGAQPVPSTSLSITSEPGDPIGEGGTFHYTPHDANFVVEAAPDHVGVSLYDDHDVLLWYVGIQPEQGEDLANQAYWFASTFPDLGPFIQVTNTHACQDYGVGAFVVLAHEFAPDGTLEYFRARFWSQCNVGTGGLRGEVVVDHRTVGDTPAGLHADVTHLDFDATPISSLPATRHVSVSNPTGHPVQLGEVDTEGIDFVPGTDTCSGVVLAAGGTCQVDVAFASLDTAPLHDTLYIPNDVETLTVELDGSIALRDLGLYHQIRPVTVFDSAKGTGRATKKKGQVKKNVGEPATFVGVTGLASQGLEAVLALVTVSGATKSGTLSFTLPTADLPPGSVGVGRSMTFASGSSVTSLVLIPVNVAPPAYLFVSTTPANVVVEALGFFGDGSGTGGWKTVPVNPRRYVDTVKGIGRGLGVKRGRISHGTVAQFVVPSGLVTVTTSGATATARLKIWPVGLPEPPGGWIPVPTGDPRSTTLPVITGTGGGVNVRLSAGSAAIAIDVVAQFQPGDSDSWDGRTVFVNPAPARGPASGTSRVTGANIYDGFGPELSVGDSTVTALFDAVGVWGALSTDTAKSTGTVRLTAPALGDGGPAGVSHTTRAKKTASNLTIWPVASDGQAMVTVTGGPSLYAFDEVAYIVSDFVGYEVAAGAAPSTATVMTKTRPGADVGLVAASSWLLGDHGRPDRATAAKVARAVKRVL